ncbi:peroxiredoxin family protein [Chryseobacterium sp. 'Rf worker isolate 10']|uniref:peroxiredoxin family protein n=1 Tax=Chryseobacterium sp. 'Rf worker isolate 10' TaxID=2887348 RepID=UPI003D6FACCC
MYLAGIRKYDFRSKLIAFFLVLTVLETSAQCKVHIQAFVKDGPTQHFQITRNGTQSNSVFTFANGSSDTLEVSPERGLYLLNFEKQGRVILLLLQCQDSLIQVYLDNKSIKITGSPESQKINMFIDTVNSINRQLKDLDMTEALASDLDRDSISNIRSLLGKRKLEVAKQTVATGETDLFTAYAIRFIPKDNFSYFSGVLDSVVQKFSGSQLLIASVNELKMAVQREATDANSLISTNQQAPNFEIPNQENKAISLSQFKGKYVLLNFWASWCPPCIEELPQLKELNRKFKNNNFVLFSVSLDHDKGKWLNAIKTNRLSWYHGSEIKGWNSSLVASYHLNSIPRTILIDPDGKVLLDRIGGDIHDFEVVISQRLK